MGENETRRTWKDYFEDQYNRDTHEQVDPNIGGFGGVQRGAYFGGDPVRRTEMVVRVGKLKNGKDEGARELIKSGVS